MKNITNSPIVILCGGKSSRMGENKSLLPFGGYKTLLEYQYRKYQDLFENIFLSLKQDQLDIYKRNCNFGVVNNKLQFIYDNSDTYSPMVALSKILKQFKDQYVFIVAVDIPFLQLETIQSLYKETIKEKYKIILPKEKNGYIHNLCGFYHSDLREYIEKLIAQDIHKLQSLINHANSKVVEFNDIKQFLNLNDKESYKKACELFMKN